MNPFTKFISQWSADSAFNEFVDQWDRFEQIVISVYRGKLEPYVAGDEYTRVWSWLRARYGGWSDLLAPYWQSTQAAGEPTRTDPFQLLLDLETASAIRGNWKAMQHLPAAREALNRYLLEHSQPAGK